MLAHTQLDTCGDVSFTAEHYAVVRQRFHNSWEPDASSEKINGRSRGFIHGKLFDYKLLKGFSAKHEAKK